MSIDLVQSRKKTHTHIALFVLKRAWVNVGEMCYETGCFTVCPGFILIKEVARKMTLKMPFVFEMCSRLLSGTLSASSETLQWGGRIEERKEQETILLP